MFNPVYSLCSVAYVVILMTSVTMLWCLHSQIRNTACPSPEGILLQSTICVYIEQHYVKKLKLKLKKPFKLQSTKFDPKLIVGYCL